MPIIKSQREIQANKRAQDSSAIGWAKALLEKITRPKTHVQIGLQKKEKEREGKGRKEALKERLRECGCY